MLLLAAALSAGAQSGPAPSGRYEDLVAFFREWRAFQKPKLVDGVPDYTARAMAAPSSVASGRVVRRVKSG